MIFLGDCFQEYSTQSRRGDTSAKLFQGVLQCVDEKHNTFYKLKKN